MLNERYGFCNAQFHLSEFLQLFGNMGFFVAINVDKPHGMNPSFHLRSEAELSSLVAAVGILMRFLA